MTFSSRIAQARLLLGWFSSLYLHIFKYFQMSMCMMQLLKLCTSQCGAWWYYYFKERVWYDAIKMKRQFSESYNENKDFVPFARDAVGSWCSWLINLKDFNTNFTPLNHHPTDRSTINPSYFLSFLSFLTFPWSQSNKYSYHLLHTYALVRYCWLLYFGGL